MANNAAMPTGVTIAGLGSRALVAILDVLPLTLLSVLVSLLNGQVNGTVMLVISIATTLLSLGWAVFLWWGYATRGQSPAAKWLRIRVLRLADGRPLGWGAYFLRELVWWGSLVLPVVWVVLVVMMVVQPRRRGWHDLAGKSVVVRADLPAAPAADARPVQRATVASSNMVGLPPHLSQNSFGTPVPQVPEYAPDPASGPIAALPDFGSGPRSRRRRGSRRRRPRGRGAVGPVGGAAARTGRAGRPAVPAGVQRVRPTRPSPAGAAEYPQVQPQPPQAQPQYPQGQPSHLRRSRSTRPGPDPYPAQGTFVPPPAPQPSGYPQAAAPQAGYPLARPAAAPPGARRPARSRPCAVPPQQPVPPVVEPDEDDMTRTHLAPVGKMPAAPRKATEGWQLRLDDGRLVTVDGLVLIGRNPRRRRRSRRSWCRRASRAGWSRRPTWRSGSTIAACT